MLKYSSVLAFEADIADTRPVKHGLQSMRFHLSGYLCSLGIAEYAYPQKLVAGLVGSEPVIRVDPVQIVHTIPRTESFGALRRRCFFVNGDWDGGLPSFSFHYTYRIMRDLLADPARDGLADSLAFKRVRTRIDTDHPVSSRGKALKTDDQIIEYLNRCLDLRDSLLKHGFQNTGDPEDHDIGLAVGADGQLLHFSHGKHRLALSKLLHLKSVRAKIRIVHPQWYMKHVQQNSAHRRGLINTNADEVLLQILNNLSLTGDLEDRPGNALGSLENRQGDAA